MPIANLCSTFLPPMILQWLDSGGDEHLTKKSTMSAFRGLYGGDDYIIHFKYSELLNIIFVTMMYGFAQPLLFPIAAINLTLNYIVERAVIAYQMKLPPTLDNRLTNYALTTVKIAPFLYLINGFWALGNPQIFSQKW